MNEQERTSHEPTPRVTTDRPSLDADELQRQRDDFYDRLLRKTAEFDNYRKRVERDRQSMADAVTATSFAICCRSSTISSAR